MQEYFFTMPYGLLGAPALFLISLLAIGVLFGFAEMFDIDSDLSADFDPIGFNGIYISSGVSKVPLLLGLTVTFWVAFMLNSVLYDQVLLPLLPDDLARWASIGTALPILFLSLYIAGFLLKPVARLVKEDDAESATVITGLTGYVTNKVTPTQGRCSVNVREGSRSFHAINVNEGEIRIGKSVRIIRAVHSHDDGELIYEVENK